ncbi:putative ubiquinone biosynthesis monooxygenase [Coemansia asiatica]|uniref:Ubiquinone biosynthesis monooxygenase COQ6, mitochondrial n=1 Tax=Coemansia asiatica TaxID=1052880 RepID=A0A9W7XFR0_9FUNG|nr:putative ubiquinone biosynthesis monooxygenase [Coemansia asiatica]
MNLTKNIFLSQLLPRVNNRQVAKSAIRTFATSGQQSSGSQEQRSEQPGIYDIVIVGGGAAGCALASALSTSRTLGKLRIAMVDPAGLSQIGRWQPPTDTYLPRTLQITLSNKRYFERRGVWDHCYTDRVQPCHRAVVTDASGNGEIDLDAAGVLDRMALCDDSVAYMIETKNLVSGLLRSIYDSQQSPIDMIERAKVVKIEPGHGPVKWPVVTLSNKAVLQARLLVGADGGNSQIRKFAGIGTYGTEYGQYGLVATLCLEQLNTTAFQRFLPTGPIAMLPFPNGYANLIWSLYPEQLQMLKSVSEELFASLVNAAFRLSPAELQCFYRMIQTGAADGDVMAAIAWRLDVFADKADIASEPSGSLLAPAVAAIAPRSRLSFPLRLRMVDSLIAERVALVGDSGHVMHPLAGQGLNMGLEDVQSLVSVLEQAMEAGQDIGALQVLKSYNKKRYVRNLAMQGVVDKIWHVFGAQAAPLVGMRSLAMNGLDGFAAAKKMLLKGMMA